MRAFITLTVDRLDCYVDAGRVEVVYRNVANRGSRVRLSSGEVMSVDQTAEEVLDLISRVETPPFMVEPVEEGDLFGEGSI